MYYNSNKSSNDYYNSYKKELAELENYRKEERIQNILKLVFLFLAFILLIAGAFYLYKYFNPTLQEQSSFLKKEKAFAETQKLPAIVIREEELPESVQLREARKLMNANIQQNATDSQKVATVKQTPDERTSSMNEKDIALIVQMIMSQMNTQQEVPLEEQLVYIENKEFETKSLKESNHYNKVILTKNQVIEAKNTSLMELTDSLNLIVNEGVDTNSNYSQEIKKEVTFRKNEMRVIVVQQGDTLSKIAKVAYGSKDEYPKIFAANPEVIRNPNQIFVGQRLRIPS